MPKAVHTGSDKPKHRKQKARIPSYYYKLSYMPKQSTFPQFSEEDQEKNRTKPMQHNAKN
jgi:hypothetical protein